MADVQRFDGEDLVVVASNGVVAGIFARNGYRGKFDDFLGIGTPVLEIIRRYGPVAEDEEDVLVIPSVPGLWYEADCEIDSPEFIHAQVGAIGVYCREAKEVERNPGRTTRIATSFLAIYHHPLPKAHGDKP